MLLLPVLTGLAGCAAHGPRPQDERWFEPPYEECYTLDCGDFEYFRFHY
jgi:hypothetical protein